nr:immunoglobulin light chain junction region [Macaca mulatta]MOW70596.1 immunoglobulin light chain junction region [Macaca mulatta]
DYYCQVYDRSTKVF